MSEYRAGHADDLDFCLAEAFRLLGRGVADRRCAFHTPVLGTVGLDGAPALRTVVLRGFAAATRGLRVHTDRRSGKIGEIARNPCVSLLFYDPGSRIQLRVGGAASVHFDDEAADAAWAASQRQSRFCYAITVAPGTRVEAPLPAPASDSGGRPNFAVVNVAFDRLEWLWLASEGHRRALFTWQGDACAASWLCP